MAYRIFLAGVRQDEHSYKDKRLDDLAVTDFKEGVDLDSSGLSRQGCAYTGALEAEN